MTVRIGFIGCGQIGRSHIERLTGSRIAGATITGVFDARPESAASAIDDYHLAEAKPYASIDALIDSPDVDALVVCSSNFAHTEPILKAIAAGKPVFTEKPMTATAADSLSIVEAEVAAGRRFVQVGFNWRFDPGFDAIKQVADSGRIGRLLMSNCRTYNAQAATSYYGTDDVVRDTLIHNIDILHYLFGDDYANVEVRCARQNSLNPNPPDVLREPQLTVFEFRSGALATVDCNVNCQYGFDVRCQLVGESGVATLPEITAPEIRSKGQRSFAIDYDWLKPFAQAYDNEFRYFIEHAAQGLGPDGRAATAWDGYLANVTSDAALESLHSGRRIELPALERPALYD